MSAKKKEKSKNDSSNNSSPNTKKEDDNDNNECSNVDHFSLATQLLMALYNWPCHRLARYPSQRENLSTFLRREFPTLIPDPDSITSPKSLQGRAQKIEVRLKADHATVKRPVEIRLSLNGQDFDVKCEGAEQQRQFFLDSATDDVVVVDAGRLGKVKVKLRDLLTTRKMTTVIPPSVQIQASIVMNKDDDDDEDLPSPSDYVRTALSRALAAGMCKVFSDFPEVEAVLKSFCLKDRQVCPPPVVKLAIEAIVEGDDDTFFNGKATTEGQCEGYKTLRLPVRSLCRDVVTFKTAEVKEEGGGGEGEGGWLSKLVGAKTEDEVNKNNGEEIVRISEIPLEKGLRKEGQWRLHWTAEVDDGPIDLGPLLRLLVLGQLKEMKDDERMRLYWNGRLSQERREVVKLCWMFSCSSARQRRQQYRLAKVKALLAASGKGTGLTFSCLAIRNALTALEESKVDARTAGLDKTQGVGEYLDYCAEVIANLELMSDADSRNLVFDAIVSTKILKKYLKRKEDEEDDLYQNAFVSLLENRAKRRIALKYQEMSLEQLTAQCINSDLPTLKFLEKTQKDFVIGKVPWSVKLAGLMMDTAMPVLEFHLSGKTTSHGEATFGAFLHFRQMLSYDNNRREKDFFRLFSGCLPRLSLCIQTKAREQVTILLAQERDRHVRKTWHVVEKKNLTRVGSILFQDHWMEGVINVEGIFNSCKVTLDKLDWPEPVEKAYFSTVLVGGLKDVFSYYLNSFYSLIIEDGVFDESELVSILNSIFHSEAFLMGMFEGMRSGLVTERVANFDKVCLNVREMARSNAETFIEAFVVGGQGKIMEAFLRSDDIVVGLLGHLRRLFDFLNSRLSDEDRFSKLLLFKRLLDTMDDRFLQRYNTYGSRLRLKLPGKEADKLRQALEEMTRFRESMKEVYGVSPPPPDSQVEAIRRRLNVKSATTISLACDHLEAMVEGRKEEEKEEEGESPELVFSVKITDDDGEIIRITVTLLSLTKVKPRGGNEEGGGSCNPSVSVGIVPSAESEGLRGDTCVYEGQTDLFFDLAAENDEEEEQNVNNNKSFSFTFAVPRDRATSTEDPLFISMELYDHSRLRVVKYFRGIILLSLQEILLLDENQRQTRCFGGALVQQQQSDLEPWMSVVWKEIGKRRMLRKDALAGAYVGWVERCTSGGEKRVVAGGKQQQEWVRMEGGRMRDRLVAWGKGKGD